MKLHKKKDPPRPSLAEEGAKPSPPERRLRIQSPLPLLLLVVALLFPSHGHAARITDYHAIRRPVTDAAGKTMLAIRSFKSDGVPHLLAIDPSTFESHDVASTSMHPSGASADQLVASSPFMKALTRYTAAPYRLQNGGATRAEGAVEGLFLTVDLCPSHRPFEQGMFEAAEGLRRDGPVPVAISVTGLWLEKHPEELSYLKKEMAAGRLAVTWVNHSFHHPYEPKVPLDRNFLLTPGTDFIHEVLDLEQLLLGYGLVPSPFFRFPGLVSSAETMKLLRELSLIPIGSDAWLAKGEAPRDGSFILVHGNGNEPKGVKLLLPMLKKKDLRLLPLAAAFSARHSPFR